ncbi:phage tail tape measure protein [Erwinia persicina]|uniref:phage tail tape measure protein n=1 Tax=Erwinia persicina TaxID=55211 RepID=UPI0016548715|nr:phage tail tape measure protein [Erwinia persicina]MBC3943778.1 phage tail tape measure protein [Erwinia persicina]
MSNNLKLQVMLKAVDQASRPFKAIHAETKQLSCSIRETQANIKAMDAQAAKIDGFRKTRSQLAVTQQSLKGAKEEAAALAVQFRNTERPTTQQARALEGARRAASELQTKSNALRLSVQQQREALNAAGISTKSLSSEQQRLKSSSGQATVSLSRQKQELQRLSQKQEQLNRVSERYRKGQELSSKVRNGSAAALGAATVGAVAGAAVLKPGYDFALANSTLQATLGLDKGSAEFQSLRTQARSIGDNTAASANDAAQAQIIIAKSGGSVDDIKAATPVTLDMSLANNRTMEESASLLMSTKNAFGLANSEVAHLGDVISATLNKTAANFDGLSDALTYIAPVAKNAGVSVEQTTAMIGALAKAGTTGSMAGTGVRAMLLRLQAPTGQAGTAIQELGVKTSDSKGNMRPFFTILKEMQRSFEKNRLGSSQQAEYMKTIFGEEAASSAVTLMKAASNGLLDELTSTFQKSDGSTSALVKIQQDNLGGDFKELQSAWEAVGTDLFDGLDSSLRSLTQSATKFLLTVDGWIKDNPKLADGMAKAAVAGVALLGALGSIGLASWPVISGINTIISIGGKMGVAFSVAGEMIVAALGAISLPVVLVAAAIVAGALLIRKYWEPISEFLKGMAAGFTAAMGPIADAFAPLKPAFDWLGDKLGWVWDKFKGLLEPVKLTQDELKAAGDMGKQFGELLAAGIKFVLSPLTELQNGIDWVLEKLGMVDDKSKKLKDNIPTDAPTGGDVGFQYPGMQYNLASGGAGYRPVTAPAGGGYTNNSTSNDTYNINMPPGISKDDALALIAQQKQRDDRNQRAAQKTKMGWE